MYFYPLCQLCFQYKAIYHKISQTISHYPKDYWEEWHIIDRPYKNGYCSIDILFNKNVDILENGLEILHAAFKDKHLLCEFCFFIKKFLEVGSNDEDFE